MAPDDLRVLPQNLEMESAVLNCILLSEDAAAVAMGILRPTHFYKMAHTTIYQAMLDLSETGEPIDTLTVTNRLQEQGNLERVGGAYYITGLMEQLPSATGIEHYCQTVLDRANERSTLAALHEASEGIYANEMTAEEAQSRVFELSDNLDPRGFSSLGEVLPETMRRIEAIAEEGMMPGIPFGHKDVDKILGGGEPGELIFIAGRPSMGKTAFAMGIIKYLASQGHPGAVASMETSALKLAMRYLMQARSNDDPSRAHEGIITKQAVIAARKEAEIIEKYPIWIDDNGLQHIDQLRARARRMKSQFGIEILMVDYLQLLSGSKAENRRLEIGEYTRKLKIMAKDLNIIVLCLSQLSRAPELRSINDRRPIMSDLRESGDIEQDADKILFLYRPEVYGIKIEVKGQFKDRDNENLCEVRVAKHKDGPTGTAELTWLPYKAQFLDRAQYLTKDDMPEYVDYSERSQPPPGSDEETPF